MRRFVLYGFKMINKANVSITCQKTFVVSDSLNTHTNTHIMVKPLTIDVC